MSFEKNTLTAEPTADQLAHKAKELYEAGASDIGQFDDLDDEVAKLNQETYKIPAFDREGNPTGEVTAKNIGLASVEDALAVHSGNWQDPTDK